MLQPKLLIPCSKRFACKWQRNITADTASQQWELSYSYSLSLRTMLYAGWVRIDNRPNAAYTFNINPYPVAPGAKPSGIVLGIAHFF